jgi:ATP-dependent RNA helicase SUPV3L1/SUV3
VAADDVLKPRIVILADEQLSGPARDMVEARLTSWVTAHIATVLKPLVELAADQTLTGMSRGIAFRLVENLGILDRRDVAEDVRGLDQDARAGLRRVGVRFGAYHVYMPALLKPAPGTLIAHLWALKHKDLDVPGLAEMPAISGSGRTSITVDPTFDPEVYRRFGFRVYGRRAVRIDILERLADLIRPALSWQAGSAGDRPPGALPSGRGFVVTPAMTSLLGASGEDLALILKGLGYRMDRVPKPVEPPPVPARAEAATTPDMAGTPDANGAGKAADPTGSSDQAGEPAPERPPSEEPPLQEPTTEPPAIDPPSVAPPLDEPQPDDPPMQEPPTEIPAAGDPQPSGDPVASARVEPVEASPQVAAPGFRTEQSTEAVAPAQAAEAGAADLLEASADPAAAAPEREPEPEMIEVWRPSFGRPRNGEGGRNRPEGAQNRGRHRRDRPEGQRRSDRPNPAQGAATADPQAGAVLSPDQPERVPRRDRPNRGEGQRHHRGPDRSDRPHRQDRPDRPGRPEPQNRPDRSQRFQPAPRAERDRPVDPDNPFAALAALRKELEKSSNRE